MLLLIVSLETPLNTWSEFAGGSSIVSVQWSRSRPCVFYVLDAASKLHVWCVVISVYANNVARRALDKVH